MKLTMQYHKLKTIKYISLHKKITATSPDFINEISFHVL